MMSNPKNRLDPRVIRTRQLLKDAFVDLIQTMEIDKITVNRLAEQATVNRVTFYLHFRDIPDMIEQMADEMVRDLGQILQNHASLNSSEQKLELFLGHIANNAKFYKAVLAVRSIPIFTDRLLSLFSDLISERMDRLENASDMNKEIAIWFVNSALLGVTVSWLRNDMPYSPHFLAKQFFQFISYW